MNGIKNLDVAKANFYSLKVADWSTELPLPSQLLCNYTFDAKPAVSQSCQMCFESKVNIFKSKILSLLKGFDSLPPSLPPSQPPKALISLREHKCRTLSLRLWSQLNPRAFIYSLNFIVIASFNFKYFKIKLVEIYQQTFRMFSFVLYNPVLRVCIYIQLSCKEVLNLLKLPYWNKSDSFIHSFIHSLTHSQTDANFVNLTDHDKIMHLLKVQESSDGQK